MTIEVNGQVFPSHGEFGMAVLHGHLQPVTASGLQCAYFVLEYAGEKYFVKRQKGTFGHVRQEEAAYELGVALGAEKFLIAQKYYRIVDGDYALSPLMGGFVPFSKDPDAARKAIEQMSSEDFTLLMLLTYLVGDWDRHKNNYMVNPATGEVKIIDLSNILSGSFEDNYLDRYKKGQYYYNHAWIVEMYRSEYTGKSAESMRLSRAALKKLVQAMDAETLAEDLPIFSPGQKRAYAKRKEAIKYITETRTNPSMKMIMARRNERRYA
jgi:hypothetical protein